MLGPTPAPCAGETSVFVPSGCFSRPPVLGTGRVCVNLTRPFSSSLAQGDISRLLEKGHYNFALTSCKPLLLSGGRSYLILTLSGMLASGSGPCSVKKCGSMKKRNWRSELPRIGISIVTSALFTSHLLAQSAATGALAYTVRVPRPASPRAVYVRARLRE
jgi:hypothetical protein